MEPVRMRHMTLIPLNFTVSVRPSATNLFKMKIIQRTKEKKITRIDQGVHRVVVYIIAVLGQHLF